MLTKDEKDYLRELVKRDLGDLKGDRKAVLDSPALRFIKAEHEYEHFIESILEKLK